MSFREAVLLRPVPIWFTLNRRQVVENVSHASNPASARRQSSDLIWSEMCWDWITDETSRPRTSRPRGALGGGPVSCCADNESTNVMMAAAFCSRTDDVGEDGRYAGCQNREIDPHRRMKLPFKPMREN